jgi:hypothetical protein
VQVEFTKVLLAEKAVTSTLIIALPVSSTIMPETIAEVVTALWLPTITVKLSEEDVTPVAIKDRT